MSSVPEPLLQMATRVAIYFSAESQEEMNQPGSLFRKLLLKLFPDPLPPRFPGTGEAMPRVRTGVKGQDLIQQYPHHPLFPAALGKPNETSAPALHPFHLRAPRASGPGMSRRYPSTGTCTSPWESRDCRPPPRAGPGPPTLSCPGRLYRTVSRARPPGGSGSFARCRGRTHPYCTDD